MPPCNENVSRRQKLQKQVQSLLLETQHNVWESTQINSLFKTNSRQKYPERKDVGILPNEEEFSKETVKSFI